MKHQARATEAEAADTHRALVKQSSESVEQLRTSLEKEKQLVAELRQEMSEKDNENKALRVRLQEAEAALDVAGYEAKCAEADKGTLQQANIKIVERLKETQEMLSEQAQERGKVIRLEEALERIGAKLLKQEAEHQTQVLSETLTLKLTKCDL